MGTTSFADLLDRCLDALLAGEDWEAIVPPGHPAHRELAGLLAIARELRDARPRWAPRAIGKPADETWHTPAPEFGPN